jgi:hypothetical protein
MADRRLKVEDLCQVAASCPDAQQLADVGEGVPALEELADEPHPRQVRV